MKGLLIKDFFCLKKQLTNYVFIIVGVIVISILFVLSYNFGNIHAGFMEMVESNQNAESDITLIARSALLLFMMIPIACTGDITNLFTDDENASFYKIASALPISIGKRVACRFLAGYLFIAIGMVVDFILTIILSSLTDIISFGKFCGVIVTFSSVMLMYISLLILLMYILGNGKSTYAGTIPLFLGAAVYVLANFDKFKAVMTGSNENALLDLYKQTTDFIFYKSYILFIAAVILSGGAYLAAVQTAKRKRGVA
ncbi:MAG: ABC-2 transporter permease [Lachnoclostridium sp.]|nr:ABC-2 transporter permease [Lachnospira sp.]MCM1248302.1 ABC-2 transporter permease [Lachnoclostridium sp.]